MRDGYCEKRTQTLVSVTPHYVDPSDPPEKIRVRSTRRTQTEVQLNVNDSIGQIENSLKYTPYNSILSDAIRIQEIPKKFVLKFDDKILEEDIEDFDLNSTWDPADLAETLAVSFSGKSNLRPQTSMSEQTADAECQTTLMVRPMLVDLDNDAQVMCNLEVQTSQTFAPDESEDTVQTDLQRYIEHKPGSAILRNEKQKILDNEVEERVIGYIDNDRSVEKKELKQTKIPKLMKSPKDIPESQLHSKDPLIKQIQQKFHMTSEHIRQMCLGCCNDEEVLERIKAWYNEIGYMLEEVDGEDGIDEITGHDLRLIEEQIIATTSMTASHLENQADRMTHRYAPPQTVDLEIQCKEFADHRTPGECTGGKPRNKDCTCDCQLYAKDKEPSGNVDFNICAKKLAELCQLVTGGMHQGPFAGRLGEVISSPALIGCPCGDQTSSDLASNRRAKTELPLKARACTNRKCNCLYSKGCLHCEKALAKAKKMEESDPNKIKSCKKFKASQNIEFLTEVDDEYADAYMEPLEQDSAFTQTEFDDYFGTPEAPFIPPPPCSCLNDIEMPWDLLLIPPTPKKRPPPEEALMESLPEMVRAQLKELTVRPITEEQLLALTKEFLEDNIRDIDNIEEIQKQILAEKARIDAEVAAAEAAFDGESDEDKSEEEKPHEPCRPRPPLRSFQVFDPECEVYNEPYLDRLMRYFCEDEMEGVGECTSRVEMPWHQIELAKTIIIRKGRHPCERLKSKIESDPNRVCGPAYRENMRRQREMFGFSRNRSNSATGIVSCLSKESRKRASNPNINKSLEDCMCRPSRSNSQPNLKTRDSVTCICPPDRLDKHAMDVKDGLSTCIRNKMKQKQQASASMPAMARTPSCPGSSQAPSECASRTGNLPKSSQPRTERIAAILDSCKRELKPIKDGINQLRARIKELDIPDLMAYQEPPQHPCPSGMGYMGMPPPIPPMCYPPPMMCYPFPPCMYPPPGPGVAAGMNSANAQVTRIPPSMSSTSSRKCKCKSKRHRHISPSTSDTNTASSDYEEQQRRRCRKKSPKRSRSRFICSCKPQESKTVACPSFPASENAESIDEYKFEQVIKEPAQPTQNQSSFCLCITPSTTSKSERKICPNSKIPRLASQPSSKISGTVCPDPSLATQQTTSLYKSCRSRSNVSDKSESCKSCKSSKKEESTPVIPPTTTSTDKNLCDHCSLMFVESAGTQSSLGNFVTCPSSRADGSQRPSILKTKPTVATTATSCKIRFDDHGAKCKSKCSKCAKYRTEKKDTGVEVKRGRPVEESSEENA